VFLNIVIAGVGKLFGVEGWMSPPTNLLRAGQVNFTLKNK